MSPREPWPEADGNSCLHCLDETTFWGDDAYQMKFKFFLASKLPWQYQHNFVRRSGLFITACETNHFVLYSLGIIMTDVLYQL